MKENKGNNLNQKNIEENKYYFSKDENDEKII